MRVPSAPSLLIAGLAIGSNAFAAPVDVSGRSPNPERSPLLVASPSPAFQDSPKFPNSPSFPAGFRRRDPAAYGALGKRSPFGNGIPSGLGIVDPTMITNTVGNVVPINSLGLPGLSQISSLGNTVTGVAGGLPITGALGGAQGGLVAAQGLGGTVGGVTGGLLGGQGGLLGSVVPAVGGTLSSVAHTVDGIVPLGLEGILGGDGPAGTATGILSATQNLPGISTLGNIASNPLGNIPVASTLSSGLPLDQLKSMTDPYLERVQGTVNPIDILGAVDSESRQPLGQVMDATYDPRLDPGNRSSQVVGGAENRKQGLTDIVSSVGDQVQSAAQKVSGVATSAIQDNTGDIAGNAQSNPPNIFGTWMNPINGVVYRARDFPSVAAFHDAQVNNLTPADYTGQKWQTFQPDGWIYDIDDPNSPFVANPYAQARPAPPSRIAGPMTPDMATPPTMMPSGDAIGQQAHSVASTVTSHPGNILGGGLMNGLGQVQGIVGGTPLGAITNDPFAAVTAKVGGLDPINNVMQAVPVPLPTGAITNAVGQLQGTVANTPIGAVAGGPLAAVSSQIGGMNPVDNVMQAIPAALPTGAITNAVGQLQGAVANTPIGAVASGPLGAATAQIGGSDPVDKLTQAAPADVPVGAIANGLGQAQGMVNGTPAGAVASDPLAAVNAKLGSINPVDSVMQAMPAAAPTSATSAVENLPVTTPAVSVSPPSEQNTYSTVVEAIKAAATPSPTSVTSTIPDPAAVAAGRAADATGVISSKTGIASPINTIRAARRWIRERF